MTTAGLPKAQHTEPSEAVALALDVRPEAGLDSPESVARHAPVLPLQRIARVFAYGITMTVGTLAVLYHGLQTGPQDRALTMAFTTFVLFQLFNVFNARNETGSAFNAQFFGNRMLWLSIGAALGLQMLATQWGPATHLFASGRATGPFWPRGAAVRWAGWSLKAASWSLR